MPPKKANGPLANTDTSIQDKYKKLDHREHVLSRPGMYVGSVDEDVYNTYVYDQNEKKMVKKEIRIIPALYKIFDEILVNTVDHYTRLKMKAAEPVHGEVHSEIHTVKNIKVTVNKEAGLISVFNDGDGIEVVEHPEHKIYIPELIFGNLLTSTNYDDNEEKIIGGQNGLGGKCVSADTLIPMYNGKIKYAKDIEIGDLIIGDDGKSRTVLHKISGSSKMYEISQTMGENYTVNEDHILTLHMPDHKVIYWKKHGWNILWWNRDTNNISAKFYKAYPDSIRCEECGIDLCGKMKRHYLRKHPEKVVPKVDRKSPTKTPDMNDERVKNAFDEITEFAKSISDDNVIDISIKDYIKLNKTTQNRLAGVRGSCVDWSYREIELDPYILGLWLGDGVHHGYSYVCDGENDSEIIEYFNTWCEKNDAQLKKTSKYTYGISSLEHFKKKGYAPLRKLLKKYDLIKNKHIPNDYIVNSRDVRLKVLAGLIDTDGTVMRDGTRITISQGVCHEKLVYNITHLVRSLGFRCTLRKEKVYYTHKDEKKESMAYKINISGNTDEIPTLLPRKKCKNTKSINTDGSCGKISIKDIGVGEYIGLEIDGNQRFVINDFTVTHNCCNIFSKQFTIETVDATRKKLYQQEFKDNMTVKSKPSIKACAKKPYTMITFLPDYERFKLRNGLSDDMYDLFVKRTYDICALTGPEVNVWLNGEKIDCKTFEKYCDLYLGPKTEHPRIYECINDRWEIVASYTDSIGFEQVSFVNGIWTIRGGKHVDYISNQICTKLVDMINKKKKSETMKPQHIKNYLMLFVKSTITNPTFDSQSKDLLTSPITKFGSKADVPDKFIDKLFKTPLVEKSMSLCEMQDNNQMKKTDGKKKSTLRGMIKLADATLAGTNKSEECTLILTEGDSAKTMALKGLQVVGREKYGVFPLKGKLLNVKDIGVKKLFENEEITNLKKILGLESNKVYENKNTLRYGSVMLMTDADVDGSHIKGLLFNMFHELWPSLFKTNGFLCSMLTPIIKARHNSTGEVIKFYNLTDYEHWKEDPNHQRGWTIKYYKGLGTSNDDEAKEYFREMKRIDYQYNPPTSDEMIDLAFNKKRADDRKEWLSEYDRNNVLDCKNMAVTYEEFVNKDLIHFSNYDIERSIPNLCDGLKVSQRKIMYGCFKRNLVKEVKVAQLSGYVSENACYHHGEASLQNAIIGLAQTFVGSNNINLLKPNGQFGSRVQGGKDASSPRYIHTELEELTSLIFKKEDQAVLQYLNDDGYPVEPQHYIPIIPMVLVNGAIGIGTGFSTSIPCFNPIDIVTAIRKRLANESINENDALIPWYRGFKGVIEKIGEGKYASRGRFQKLNQTTIRITELPIGVWTEDFKLHLEEMIDKRPEVKNYEIVNDIFIDIHVMFGTSSDVDKYLAIEDNGYTKFENDFKLVCTKNLSINNMYLFNRNGQIHKYNTINEIIDEFMKVRLEFYQKRKEYLLNSWAHDLKVLENKYRFINEVINGDLVLSRRKKADIISEMTSREYYPNTNNATDDGFNYMLNMPMHNMTEEKLEELDKSIKQTKSKITELEKKATRDIWIDELNEFEIKFKTTVSDQEIAQIQGDHVASSSSSGSGRGRGSGRGGRGTRGRGTGRGRGRT